MRSRTLAAAAMGFRDQLRRPLVPILLVIVPVLIVVIAVAQTEPSPRQIELPGGTWVTTTMKALHGPEMAKFAVAFVAALVGVFVMQASLQGDRRLIVAGFAFARQSSRASSCLPVRPASRSSSLRS